MTFADSANLAFGRSNDFPLEWHPVPGGESSAWQHPHGKLAIQELACPSCQVVHMVYRMTGRSQFRVRDKGPLLLAYLALQEDQRLEVEGLGKVHFREGQYNFLYTPDFDMLIDQEGSKEYITLCLNYQLHTLQEMTPYFPGLAAFLGKVQEGQPALLQTGHAWLTGEIQDAIYRVLHCPVNIVDYPVYFDPLVKTLLFHLLLQFVQQQPASKYAHYEVEAIYRARDMIRKNLRYHFVIPEIAQKVGMNEFKLKNGFRELFGNGVYEYLHIERMMEARQLLDDPGRSIKEIAALTGYKSVNSFIKAFKKKFHQTPGEFRKRA